AGWGLVRSRRTGTRLGPIRSRCTGSAFGHDVGMEQGRIDRLAAEYRRFSVEETAGRSALYTEITRAVAEDRELLAIMCELEPPKRQSNLLLAAVRHLH